jgi:glycosyltransferase involved in cell wall biosynthesis
VVETKPNILLVSTNDRAGGAEQIALSLLQGYLAAGSRAALAVGTRSSRDPHVFELPQNPLRRSLGGLTRTLLARRVRILPKITFQLSRLGDMPNEFARRAGREPFHYPGTRQLLELAPFKPQLVHAHNLHRDYFDLRFLPELSARLPLVLTLHDAWLMSGHCAHSFACERWKTGCGECPDLTIPPAIARDATAFNWRRKREIYARSRFYVALPSRWLLKKLKQSILAPAVIESRVIPNGIDLEVFRAGDRAAVRTRLGLPQNADILLFTALSIRENVWKDYATLRGAIARLAERRPGRPLIFLAVGEEGPNEKIGSAEIRFVPFLADSQRVAEFYQAADLYLHAARADTFPTSILEALACELPVVATAVGGIPEQIIDGETGMLTPPGDAPAMADAIASLLDDAARRRAMSAKAGEEALRNFGRDRMIENYLCWFGEILCHENQRRHALV